MDKKIKLQNISREEKLFRHMPIWKSLLIMSVPSILMMLIFGLYTFMDNVLSINFADDHYKRIGMYSGRTQVRFFMSGITPITTFMFSISMLFGIGVSRRVSINIGAGKEERAINTMKTAMQIGLGVSIVLIPILFLSAKPWMIAQFDGDHQMANLIADQGFKYIWIIILAFPLQMFTQILSTLFRTEARNKEALIATFIPLLLNLLFDWIFMGPLGMGIEGGAWATFISYTITAMLFILFIFKNKKSRFQFRNLFGKRGFQWITIIGVILVGIAPFMRNMAQSITQTIEMRKTQEVSVSIYGNDMEMPLIMTAVFPIFGLFFPMMFGFIQAGSPIAGYNYGAKDFNKVKQITIYIIIYSTIMGVLIFVISTFALMAPLNHLLGIENEHILIFVPENLKTPPLMEEMKKYYKENHWDITNVPRVYISELGVKGELWKFKEIFHTVDKSQKMYGIMMIAPIFFGPALGGMSLFGSTDRVLFNIIASSLRGVILLVPILYIFASIAMNNPGDMLQNNIGTNKVFSCEFLFWWFYPVLAFITSIILLILTIFTMKRIDNNHKSLEERINSIHQWNKNRKIQNKR